MLKSITTLRLGFGGGFVGYVPWFVFIAMLIALLLYPFLPDKKITVIPSSETTINLNYTESIESIKWLDKEYGHWQCSIKKGVGHRLCGVYLNWLNKPSNEGRDLSSFNSIKFNLNYQGNAKKIRLFLRNYNTQYSTPNDYNSPQYLHTEFKPQDLTNGEITLSMSEITVADWWIEQHQHPREYTHPNFRNIIAFGVEVYGDDIYGEHSMILNKIDFVGPFVSEKNYYLIIIITVLCCMFLYLLAQLYLTKKYVITVKEKRKNLAKTNKALAEEKAKYRKLSMLDALTQVPNRHGFEEFVFNAMNESLGNAGLVVIDIDYFKKINDQYGHSVGDESLKKLALLLQNNTRSNDYFARWGGEEFIIFCLNTSDEELYRLSEKIRLLVKNTKFTETHKINLTVSLGATIRGENEQFKHWFIRADQALYQAKDEGRNRTIIARQDS